MKLIRLISLALILLIVILGSLDVLFGNLLGLPAHPFWGWLPEALRSDSRFLQRLYATLALALPIAYLTATWLIWKSSSEAIKVQSRSGGLILLHPATLQRFVRTQLDTHPAVVSHGKIDVHQSGRKGVGVDAMVNVEPIAALHSIQTELESSIRDGLVQIMGIEKVGDIKIVLGIDEKSMKRRPGSSARPRPKPEPPTRAPLSPQPRQAPARPVDPRTPLRERREPPVTVQAALGEEDEENEGPRKSRPETTSIMMRLPEFDTPSGSQEPPKPAPAKQPEATPREAPPQPAPKSQDQADPPKP